MLTNYLGNFSFAYMAFKFFIYVGKAIVTSSCLGVIVLDILK